MYFGNAFLLLCRGRILFLLGIVVFWLCDSLLCQELGYFCSFVLTSYLHHDQIEDVLCLSLFRHCAPGLWTRPRDAFLPRYFHFSAFHIFPYRK